MHELTLAESTLQIIEAAALKAQARRISRVRLAIGALAHVDPDTLSYCCTIASRGTLAESAVFEVERVPGRAQCADCRAEVELAQVGFPCPRCGGFELNITDGDQMRILDIGIEE